MDRAPGLHAHHAGSRRLAPSLRARGPAGRLSGVDRDAGYGRSPLAPRTARLLLSPVSPPDLRDIQAIKADPRVFAIMLGGIRSAARAAEELAEEMAFWAVHRCGMWSVRATATGKFLGLVGFMDRPDGRGIALRFAFWPEAQGQGIAREAAAEALRFGHATAGLERIVAVTRETNFASRTILGSIGMREADTFEQGGQRMILYESRNPAPLVSP